MDNPPISTTIFDDFRMIFHIFLLNPGIYRWFSHFFLLNLHSLREFSPCLITWGTLRDPPWICWGERNRPRHSNLWRFLRHWHGEVWWPVVSGDLWCLDHWNASIFFHGSNPFQYEILHTKSWCNAFYPFLASLIGGFFKNGLWPHFLMPGMLWHLLPDWPRSRWIMRKMRSLGDGSKFQPAICHV